jgi:hypothetical protein
MILLKDDGIGISALIAVVISAREERLGHHVSTREMYVGCFSLMHVDECTYNPNYGKLRVTSMPKQPLLLLQ